MLSNAYFLAKSRFGTAENEPAKNLQNFAKKKCYFSQLEVRANYGLGGGVRGWVSGGVGGGRRRHWGGGRRRRAAPARRDEARRRQFLAKFRQNVVRYGCIGNDFCKKICVLQHFSKSTRF